MPKVRASSGMIGTTRRPQFGSRIRLRMSFAATIVVDTACFSPVPAANSSNTLPCGCGTWLHVYELRRPRRCRRLGAHDELRHEAAELAAPLVEVAHLVAVRARVVVGRIL